MDVSMPLDTRLMCSVGLARLSLRAEVLGDQLPKRSMQETAKREKTQTHTGKGCWKAVNSIHF